MAEANEGGFELGLFVPGEGGAARDVSGGSTSCPGCRWDLVPACEGNRPDASNTGGGLNCPRAAVTCLDASGLFLDVYLKRPGEPWQLVNSFCRGPDEQVSTPAQIAADAARTLRDLPLPQPGLRAQPAGASVVHLPTIFYSDDTADITTTATVRGFAATLTAKPVRWDWAFGDGSTLSTTGPGAPYPDHSVSHPYADRGTVTASVTTTWAGVVTVPGIAGDIEVTETVTRTTTRVVTIREARAELVEGG